MAGAGTPGFLVQLNSNWNNAFFVLTGRLNRVAAGACLLVPDCGHDQPAGNGTTKAAAGDLAIAPLLR